MGGKIFAHRGASQLAPENTMPAFELAYQLKADAIETDVQLTKDRIPVLFHDIRLNRTTNQKGYIKDFTYEQLTKLDAGSWFSKKYIGTSIVSLEDFLKWVEDKPLMINLELKNHKIAYKHLEEIVLEMIEYFQMEERIILSSFNPASVQRLAKMTHIQTAFLTSKRRTDLVEYAQSLGATALHIHYRLLRRNIVEQSRNGNMPLRIYTVNKRRQLLRCFHKKCDGIITDVPHKAKRIRNLFRK